MTVRAAAFRNLGVSITNNIYTVTNTTQKEKPTTKGHNMTNLFVTITVEWHKSRTDGWNPTVQVTTTLDGIRKDETTARAVGGWYDKASAATSEAFNENPLCQTLLLWNKWEPISKNRQRSICTTSGGKRWNIDDMNSLVELMEHNRFSSFVDASNSVEQTVDTYEFVRDMPQSFVDLV